MTVGYNFACLICLKNDGVWWGNALKRMYCQHYECIVSITLTDVLVKHVECFWAWLKWLGPETTALWSRENFSVCPVLLSWRKLWMCTLKSFHSDATLWSVIRISSSEVTQLCPGACNRITLTLILWRLRSVILIFVTIVTWGGESQVSMGVA